MPIRSNKLLRSTSLLFALSTGYSFSAYAFDRKDDDAYWLNKWSDECYQDGTNICREAWYKTPQGSHMMLYEVFLALEQADSRNLFTDEKSLSKYGFLFTQEKKRGHSRRHRKFDWFDRSDNLEKVEAGVTEGKLPIGMVKDTNQLDNKNYLGFNCAACHTGEITLEGQRYFVEAGQSNIDLHGFFNDLVSALEANLEGKKLKRFERRFKFLVHFGYDKKDSLIDGNQGQAYLEEALANFSSFMQRNVPAVENGPYRLDAIGTILNEVLLHQSGLAEIGAGQPKPITAPVNYPYIWDAPELSCIQTNCVSADPLTRNAAQVLGVFGNININGDEGKPDMQELYENSLGLNNLFETTTKVDNIFLLENTLGKIDSPRWPDNFPAIDSELAEQGKHIYNAQCASCHVDVSDGVDETELSAPNPLGFQFTKVVRVPFTEVGTDPAFIQDYALRVEPTGILGSVLSLQLPESINPLTGIPYGEEVPQVLPAFTLLGTASAIVEKNHFESDAFIAKAIAMFPELPPEQAHQKLMLTYTHGHIQPRDVNPFVYRAKPLNGIAFTGPYLHNGSVRTLTDLLTPPAERPSAFNMGSTEFDPVNLGYIDEGDFVMDTTVRGNSKDGHAYGTDLTNDEKQALLEYLKGL